MPESLSPIQPATTTERLLRFESACEAIWPAIRAFGLCGGHPQYLAAVIEIGDLLGKHNPAGPAIDTAALILDAKRDARDEIASFFDSSPDARAKLGRQFAHEAAELCKKLQVSTD